MCLLLETEYGGELFVAVIADTYERDAHHSSSVGEPLQMAKGPSPRLGSSLSGLAIQHVREAAMQPCLACFVVVLTIDGLV